MTTSTPSRHNMDQLWERITQQGVTVGKLETSINQLTASVTDIARAMSSLRTELEHRQKTQWSPIFAGASVFLTIISLVGGLVAYTLTQQIARNSGDLEDMMAVYNTHVNNGHPYTVIQRTERNKQDLDRVTADTRRELAQRLQEVINRLKVVEDWQRNNNVKNSAAISEMKAEIYALKDYVKKQER